VGVLFWEGVDNISISGKIDLIWGVAYLARKRNFLLAVATPNR